MSDVKNETKITAVSLRAVIYDEVIEELRMAMKEIEGEKTMARRYWRDCM